MGGNFYDNPVEVSYRFPAAAISAAGVFGRFIGPDGRAGRVRSLTYIITTATTAAASVVTLDTGAGLTTPLSVTVPVATADNGGSATKAAVEATSELPADTVVELSSDGGSTAGAADIVASVGWF